MLFPWADYLFGNKAPYFFIISFSVVIIAIVVLTKLKKDQDKAKAARGF